MLTMSSEPGTKTRPPRMKTSPLASAVMKVKCYIKLTDIDGQMHISVGAAPSTDRSQLDHTSFSVQWLSNSHTAL
jgi:hypothetical protein